MSVHTLRYYERAGLLPPIDRDASGHRRYTADDLNWIALYDHWSTYFANEVWAKALASLQRSLSHPA